MKAAQLRKYLPLIRDASLLEDLAGHALYSIIDPKQTLLREAQSIEYVPLLISGGVKVVRQTKTGKRIFLYFIRPGETCTMTLSSCLRQQTSRVIALSVVRSEALLVPIERVYYYTRHFPGWNAFTLEAYRTKFDTILSGFENLAFSTLSERVVEYLNDLAEITGSTQLVLSHEELADDLGTSRVGISRVLKQLEQKGDLKLGRNQIEVIPLTAEH